MATILTWDTPVRLKHVPSGRYLAFSTTTKNPILVSARASPDDPSTIFAFAAVIRERPEISLDSYTRVQHVASGTSARCARQRISPLPSHRRPWP
jgi:hypothetical protein